MGDVGYCKHTVCESELEFVFYIIYLSISIISIISIITVITVVSIHGLLFRDTNICVYLWWVR